MAAMNVIFFLKKAISKFVCLHINTFWFLYVRLPKEILLLILAVLFQDDCIGIIKKQNNYRTEKWLLTWERIFVGKVHGIKQKL